MNWNNQWKILRNHWFLVLNASKTDEIEITLFLFSENSSFHPTLSQNHKVICLQPDWFFKTSIIFFIQIWKFLEKFDDGHVESLLFKTLYQKTKISPLQTCLKHKFNQASTKAHWIANWHTTSFIPTTPFWKQPTFTKCEKNYVQFWNDWL